jgi:hypothetical protein
MSTEVTITTLLYLAFSAVMVNESLIVSVTVPLTNMSPSRTVQYPVLLDSASHVCGSLYAAPKANGMNTFAVFEASKPPDAALEAFAPCHITDPTTVR